MKNKNKSGLAGAVVLIGAAAFCLPAHSAETKLLLSTSFDSLKGKFGQTQETKATSLTVGGTLIGESFRFGVYVPYVSLEGPGVLVGGTVTRASSNTVNRTSGMGDALEVLVKAFSFFNARADEVIVCIDHNGFLVNFFEGLCGCLHQIG